MDRVGTPLFGAALLFAGSAAAQDAPAAARAAPAAPAAPETPPAASPAAPAPPPTAPPPTEAPPDAPPTVAPQAFFTTPDAPPPPETTSPRVRPFGYVEVYYAYNFRRPSNGITNFRGFDNRHNTFSLSNAVLGAEAEAGPVGAKLSLQVGSTPSSYYAGEPARAGAAGANATSAELWKYLQEAYVTYRAPVGRGLLLHAGLVASPFGREAFAVKDNWCWSRTNLFFGFPYYHAGVRGTYAWSDRWSSTVSVFNGWNSVVDNNEEKSVQTSTTYRLDEGTSVTALYFGGVERTTGSPEGPYWRHHFDFVAEARITRLVSVAMQADYGFEPNRIGIARWWAAAAASRIRIAKPLHLVFRGDRFHEHLATDDASGGRSSSPIFWGGAEWVTSGTSTLDLQPHEQISVRLEARHDVAEAPLYFRGDVAGDGSAASPYVPNARTQTTVLLGTTAWF